MKTFLFLAGICMFHAAIEPSLAQVVSDVVGKLVVGYQGWFAIPGDGSPRGIWTHWGNPPSPGYRNITFELYPDMREYTRTYQAGNLGNLGSATGPPARLFSSWDDSSIDLHFRWMQTYGIEVAALQVGNHFVDQFCFD